MKGVNTLQPTSTLKNRRTMATVGIICAMALLFPGAAGAQPPLIDAGGTDGLWDPSTEIQAMIDQAEPGAILVFVASEEEAPSYIGTADEVEGFDAQQNAAAGVPAALGCLMTIYTPQNLTGPNMRFRAVVNCTNTMQYIRGEICPEDYDEGSRFWVRWGSCSSVKKWFASGLTVQTDRGCRIGTRYRTYGSLRADFANQSASDAAYSAQQNCV